MEAGGEPSESEPTFTPPGSLQRPEDLPIEQSELRDLDFDLLEQQQFGGQQLDNPARGSWADQQDQPEGLDPNVDLIDLGGDGAAFGAPAEDNPEPVVHGPPNYNIFHGESPPRLIETKQEEIASGVAPSAPEVEPVFVKKEDPITEATPVDPIGDVDYDPDDAEDDPAPILKVLLRAHHPVLLGKKVFSRSVDEVHGAARTKRKSLLRDNFIK